MFKLENVITTRHFDAMAKLMLVTSWIAAYAYIAEFFLAWYSGDRYEIYQQLVNRPFGWYALLFWLMLFCNCVITQLFWSRRMRTNLKVLFVVSLLINVGMWSERFVIILVSINAQNSTITTREHSTNTAVWEKPRDDRCRDVR